MRAVVAVVLFVTALHAGLWGLFRGQEEAANFSGKLQSVSYSPFAQWAASPFAQWAADNIPIDEKMDIIRADLKALASITGTIRLYSSTGGEELVPPIANEFGLKVMLGAWVDRPRRDGSNSERTELEIKNVIDLAKRNSNVIAIFVGNETLFRGDQKAADLIKLIQRVKSQINVPVTTGEIFSEWMKDASDARREYRPSLASSVDFIAAHILPYWNDISNKQAIDYAMRIYQEFRGQYFPGKRIMIAEFGWPSAGYNRGPARPGQFEQAAVLRNFVSRAEANGMEYNIIEGIDRPWLTFFDSGPYWGMLNAAGEPKFAWTGPITNPYHWKLATIALLVSILLSLPILRLGQPTPRQAVLLSAIANGIGAWIATVFAYWKGHYFLFGSFELTLGMILLVPLLLIAMVRIEEIAAPTRKYSLGWLNRLSAERLSLVVVLLNLIWWGLTIAFAEIMIPDSILTLPVMAAFMVLMPHLLLIYRLRVEGNTGQMLRAMVAMIVHLVVGRVPLPRRTTARWTILRWDVLGPMFGIVAAVIFSFLFSIQDLGLFNLPQILYFGYIVGFIPPALTGIVDYVLKKQQGTTILFIPLIGGAIGLIRFCIEFLMTGLETRDLFFSFLLFHSIVVLTGATSALTCHMLTRHLLRPIKA